MPGETGGGLIRPLSAYGLTLIAAMAAIYLVSQIMRNSVSVIAPDLAAEIGLSAGQLGLLSSAFFMAFAAAQIPLGISIDRFGPKICMLVCAAIAVAGAVLFALARTPTELVLARVLMGLGSCCYLMAPLNFFARRFPAHQFTTLAGIQIGLGTLGTLIATAPLAWSAAAIGWRMTFLIVGGGIALCGVVLMLVLPGERRGEAEAAPRETLRESFAGVVLAMRTPAIGRLFIMHLMSYAGFVLIVGLWGGPYLAHVYGLGLTERGDFLFLAAAAQTVGLFCGGLVERLFGGVKLPVILGTALTGGLLLMLAVVGVLPPWGLMLWLVVFGLVSAYSPLLIAHGQALFPRAVLGRGMTLVNIGSFAGVFLSQALTGAIIDLFPVAPSGAYPLDAYRTVFAVQAVLMLLAIIPYFGAADPTRGKREA